MKSLLSQLIDINPHYLSEENLEDKVIEEREEREEIKEMEDSIKIRENSDFISDIGFSFITNLVIGAIIFVYVLFSINYLYLFWQFIKVFIRGSNYLFGLLWDSLDKGQEWLQIAVIVSSIAAGWCVLTFANDMDDRIDICIAKLKAELLEKDMIILKLTEKHNTAEHNTAEHNTAEHKENSNWETTSEIYSDSDNDDELDDDDSDYDPEEDEY